MTGKITIVGLGSSDENHLSIGIYRLLKNAKKVYLRTTEHPVVAFLEQENISFQSFDFLYDTLSEYDQVYNEISETLLEKAKAGETMIYAVPGHPMVAEKSVQNMIYLGENNGVKVEIVGGESFLDTFFSRLKVDPIDGFIFLNGEVIQRRDLDPYKNIIIGQVYDKWVASDCKLTLMELYPDEMPIYIVSNLGIEGKEIIKEVPLYQLDHNEEDFHHLSSLYIPKYDDKKVNHSLFQTLVEIIDTLRSPEGCPWDRAQTHLSIRKNLIEETYELAETIDQMDMEHMEEELGDVLLQVMLHSQIAAEEGYFTIYDVIKQLNDKLVRRHPHVFGEEKAEKAEEALNHWQEVKRQEKAEQGQNSASSYLDGIPKDFPAILKAYTLQKKAAKVGFDWDDIKDVYGKILEELEEVQTASDEYKMGEVGDLLFAVVNLARFLKVDPEQALALTNLKFQKRFHYIEKKLKEKNMPIEEASLEVMESLWIEAKKRAEG